MPGGYAEGRNLVFHTVPPMAALLGHEKVNYCEGGRVMISMSILWALVLALFTMNREQTNERN